MQTKVSVKEKTVSELVVGDTLYVPKSWRGVGNEYRIEKVGNKYFTLSNRTVVFKDSLRDKTDTGSPLQYYLSQDVYEAELIAQKNYDKIRRYFAYNYKNKLTSEQIVAILAIIKQEEIPNEQI